MAASGRSLHAFGDILLGLFELLAGGVGIGARVWARSCSSPSCTACSIRLAASAKDALGISAGSLAAASSIGHGGLGFVGGVVSGVRGHFGSPGWSPGGPRAGRRRCQNVAHGSRFQPARKKAGRRFRRPAPSPLEETPPSSHGSCRELLATALCCLMERPMIWAPATTTERLEQAIESAGLGEFQWDVLRDVLHRQPAHGGDHRPSRRRDVRRKAVAGWNAHLHPDDAHLSVETRAAVSAGANTFDTRFRFIRPDDGRIVWLRSAGVVSRGTDGRLSWHGVVEDITARKRGGRAAPGS